MTARRSSLLLLLAITTTLALGWYLCGWLAAPNSMR